MYHVEDKISVGRAYASINALCNSCGLITVLKACGVTHIRASCKRNIALQFLTCLAAETLHSPFCVAINIGSRSIAAQ